MAHRRAGRRAVPVLFTGSEPHDIAWPDFLNWATFALRPSQTGRDNQGLTEGVGMPGCARAWLECNECSEYLRRLRGLNSGSIRTLPVNQSLGPLPEGVEPLRLISIFHSNETVMSLIS
jgi:hypothetical protein